VKAIGFIGDSGSGKTTLIERLIERFSASGLRVAAIKHAHHGFDIDRPGKDSYRFRSAGAAQVLIASDRRWALLSDEPQQSDPASALARQMARLDPCDLVLVEGYRSQTGIAFIEVMRKAQARSAGPPAQGPVAAARVPIAGVIALASDALPPAQSFGPGIAFLDLNDVEAIARFIAGKLEVPLC